MRMGETLLDRTSQGAGAIGTAEDSRAAGNSLRDSVTEAVRAQPGILEVRPFSKAESARLLEPWLGTGLSLDDLPVPRVIVLRVAPGSTPDLAALRRSVAQAAPSATLDDHRAWIERMRSMTGAIVLAGTGILILVIVATVISAAFAPRDAMAAHRPLAGRSARAPRAARTARPRLKRVSWFVFCLRDARRGTCVVG